MSRNFAVLEKARTGIQGGFRRPQPAEPLAAQRNEFRELIPRVFAGRAAVAIIGSGRDDVSGICADIAGELATAGKLVVVVEVSRLLQLNPKAIPNDSVLERGAVRNVWHWPAPPGQQIEFFKSRDPDRWLEGLRQRFDSVLLSCPSVESAPGCVRMAAMSDAAIIVAEAGATEKGRLGQDLAALRRGGVNLAGSILIRKS